MFEIGTRVEIPIETYEWKHGDRFGAVMESRENSAGVQIVRVAMDRSGRSLHFRADRLRVTAEPFDERPMWE